MATLRPQKPQKKQSNSQMLLRSALGRAQFAQPASFPESECRSCPPSWKLPRLLLRKKSLSSPTEEYARRATLRKLLPRGHRLSCSGIFLQERTKRPEKSSKKMAINIRNTEEWARNQS